MVSRVLMPVIWIGLALVCPAGAEELTAEQLSFFEAKIRPVLIKECYSCHSNESGNARGGLRLDTKQLSMIGGSGGPAIVPGELSDSLLWSAINHEDFVMPPKKKLPADVIRDFQTWIEMGAPDPRETEVVEVRSTITSEDILDAKQNFWAYQTPVKPPLPSVVDPSWPRTDADYFIARKHQAEGLTPAGDGQPHQILRRLCFDLIGLPPTPDQLARFTQLWNKDPDVAVAKVVDSLLDRDEFGERWGRHWLDVARYAESTGREVNMTYPHAWRYRDFVINSFNDDKPFDHFVQQQIAGDLLPAKDDDQWAENLVATTFLAMGAKNLNEQNRTQFVADLIDEQIDATTRVFLGTSVACARCHDHKFDPIPTADYYALAGIFRNTKTYFGNPPSDFGAFTGVQARRQSSLLLLPVDDPNPFDKNYSDSELQELRDDLTDKIRQQSEARRNRDREQNQQIQLRLANEIADLSAKLAVVDSDGRPRSYCMGVQEIESPSDARVLVRGEIDQPGPIVPRGFPEVLCSTSLEIDPDHGGRLELARLIGSEQNPLTARVMVNRIWQHLIGQGIVRSTENFGSTGEPPTHPELLDHLSVKFIESGWSVKSVIREIANSRVYRMSSQFDRNHFEADPDNAYLWRAHSRRLDAEAMRDAMLHICGELDLNQPRGSEVAKAGYVRVRAGILGDPREKAREMFTKMGNRRSGDMRRRFGQAGGFSRGAMNGPVGSMRDGMDSAMANELRRKIIGALDMEDARFRSVYLPIVRDELPRSLEVFDFADANTVIGTREQSNTANQALYLMNNRFVIRQSELLAKRISGEHSKPAEMIEAAFLAVLGRPPSVSERKTTAAFIQSFSAGGNANGQRDTLAAFCQSLFASAEFRYLD